MTLCPRCHYDLAGIARGNARCPECGCDIALEAIKYAARQKRRSDLKFVIGGSAIALMLMVSSAFPGQGAFGEPITELGTVLVLCGVLILIIVYGAWIVTAIRLCKAFMDWINVLLLATGLFVTTCVLSLGGCLVVGSLR